MAYFCVLRGIEGNGMDLKQVQVTMNGKRWLV